MMIGLAISPCNTALLAGVPEYLTIDGILARLLIGADNQPLQGADGQYLYGRA